MVQLRATFLGRKPFAFSACAKTLYFFCHTKHRWCEEVMRVDNILLFAPNAGRASSASLLRPVLCLFQSLRELDTQLTRGKRRKINPGVSSSAHVSPCNGRTSVSWRRGSRHAESQSASERVRACVCVCGEGRNKKERVLRMAAERMSRAGRPRGEHLQ